MTETPSSGNRAPTGAETPAHIGAHTPEGDPGRELQQQPTEDRPDVTLAAVFADIVRRNPGSRLPGRIRERVREREDQAEVLVRVIQLMIVIVFGTLYIASPKVGDTMMQAFTPAAIGGYFVVTIIGLVWSLRARLPDWAVYWSLVMDLGLLFVMIWSFHLQYEQPAAFYLKAPTLLYVFIFIALRALRFQARFVVAAGFLGAIGWLALVAYAVSGYGGSEGSVITRDYVAYLTGNLVLIGGEIDKVVSILMVTGILALVIRRARGTLVEAVAESAAAEDLSQFFDAPVAERIRASAEETEIGRGVTRTIAIVNIDIRGFTPLAATLAPADVMALLSEYQARFIPIIHDNGGAIDKFLGDGIMATFGASEDDATAPARALTALEAIADEAQRWSDERRAAGDEPLEVNAAAAAGPAICGAIGHGSRREYTVIGAAVNLAAKLEKANKMLRSRALTDTATLALAKSAGYRPSKKFSEKSSGIEGVDGAVDLVIIA